MIVKDIKSILKNICVTYPEKDRLRINSFAVIPNRDAFTTSNFTMSHEDYLNGSAWSRNWEQEGADENTFKIEYPCLVVSLINSTGGDGKKTCFKLEVGIIDIKESCVCENGLVRDEFDFRLDLIQIMENVFNELANHEEWTKVIYRKWITPQYYAKLHDKTGWAESGKKMSSQLKNKSAIQLSRLGMEKEQAAFMSFDVCECMPKVDFNYAATNFNAVAYTKCETC